MNERCTPGGRYSQKPPELTNTLDLKVASNLSWALEHSSTAGSEPRTASTAGSKHEQHTCCKAGCQVSKPGWGRNGGSLLQDTLTGSTGGSGHTTAERHKRVDSFTCGQTHMHY